MMTSFGWIILIAFVLFAVVALMISFVTFKYYWGERGRPPVVGEERRRQFEEELQRREKQFEYSRKHPRKPRNISFWNNRKVD